MQRAYMEYHDEEANSHKYWSAEMLESTIPGHEGPTVKIRYGRVPGYDRSMSCQGLTKMFASEDEAKAFIEKKHEQKYNKGYDPADWPDWFPY